MSGQAAAEQPLPAKPARDFSRGEAANETTLHKSSHGFATRVHSSATKTKALARKIPPATQAKQHRGRTVAQRHFVCACSAEIILM